MITHAISILLLGLLDPVAADTTISVRPGERLTVESFAGRLLVETWNRDEVLIEVDGGGRGAFDISSRGGEHRVKPSDRKGRDQSRSYSVRLPAWIQLEVSGRELEVEIKGLRADLEVRVLEGDISIDDVKGHVVARSVDGVLSVNRAEGRIELFSLDDDVWANGISGELRVEANDGDVHLTDIDARIVEANTVDGEISFAGTLHSDGRYVLVTHDGDITLMPYGEPSARVFVSTYDGEFESDFPVVLERLRSGEQLEFRLGDGAAEVHLEAFDGEVRIEKARGNSGIRRRNDEGNR